MSRLWLDSYPDSVPQSIDKAQYHSLAELFNQSCKKYKNHHAMYCFGHHWVYQELFDYARRFACFLRHELELKTGDRASIMMPNLPQYPVAIFGAMLAGVAVVNVNPMFTAYELQQELKDAQPKAIVVLESFVDTLMAVDEPYRPRHVVTTEAGDMLPAVKRYMTNLTVRYWYKQCAHQTIKTAYGFLQALEIGQYTSNQLPTLDRNTVAFIQYTGGTTGLPKGAVLTHGNIIANVAQISAWVKDWIEPGQESVVTALPLYHIFALTICGLAFVTMGFCSVLIPNPKDMKRFIKTLKKHPFSIFVGVNTLYQALLNQPDFSKLDFSSLKFGIGGGMPIQPQVADSWQQVTDSPIIEGYGLTEASPVVSINRMDGNVKGSIGLPVPSTEVVIRNEDNQTLAQGEKGELQVKGPQVMQGYWQNDQETANVFTEDGYLRTGDIAYMDEGGYLYIVDRQKDMIVVSGFNVYPAEVEKAIIDHESVKEAAVVGVTDDKSGEVVKAFIVTEDKTVNEDTLKEHCRRYLTRYKVPKHIEFVNDLPKSSVGKVLRRQLRD